MTRRRAILLLFLGVATLPGRAVALTSDQVVVVANANSRESMMVASYYLQQRGLDASQVIAVETTAGYLVSREDYLRQIAQPIRQALIQRGLAERTRCLVLTWGMPVRVAAPKDPIAELCAAEATKAHYRLAVDYKLLGTVGHTFPPPRTTGLAPLAELFESPTPPVPEPLPAWEAILKDVRTMLDRKYRDMKAMPTGEKKQIAARQLMALYLDVLGREGLIEFLRQAELSSTALLDRLADELEAGRAKLAELRAAPASVEGTRAILKALQDTGGVAAVGAYCRKHKPSTDILASADAAVDSELTLLWAGDDYPLDHPLGNPLYWRREENIFPVEVDPPAVLLTARLDGPSHVDALRIIRESVQTEQTGLSGKFYIDVGGPDRAKRYDEILRDLDRYVRAATSLNVVTDESAAVFQPGSCPDAALYVGWYSLQKYVPAFRWVPGSVGWHVASFEAMHLRDPSSPEWCPQMIQGGIAATIGAVDEPTLGAMPVPKEFFALLLSGRYTLAECYWRTTPMISWRMLLIGDPLYNPFKTNPQLGPQHMPPALMPPSDWPPAYTSPPASAPASTPATTSAPAG